MTARPKLLTPEQLCAAIAVDDEMLTWPEVRKRVKYCRNTVGKMERAGTFPRRQQITDYSVRWRKSEIAAWIAGKRDWSEAKIA